MAARRMHQTTVRFSSDLWETLETECRSLEISVAQYLREAAIARIAYTAGRREEPVYAAALDSSVRAYGGLVAESATESVQSSDAVLRQSRLARQRARRLRIEAEATRVHHRALRMAARKLRAGE